MSLFWRTRRAFPGDARFLIGIVLIIASIGAVWLILSSSGHTTPVLQANRTIVQGEALLSADFQVVEVGLGMTTDDYLAPQDLRPDQVASRTLLKGELIPVRASMDADDSRTTTILIPNGVGVPRGVAAGSAVELWHAPSIDDQQGFESSRMLVADVVVSDVRQAEGILSSEDNTIEVVIDRSDVAQVLNAVTSGDALAVVPVGKKP